MPATVRNVLAATLVALALCASAWATPTTDVAKVTGFEPVEPSSWALVSGVPMQAGGLTLTVPSDWSVDERPGLERSLLQGRREAVEQDGVRVERTVFPDVTSVAAYAPGGAAVIVHAYRREDLPEPLEVRGEALAVAFDDQLVDLEVLASDVGDVAGTRALISEYLATDPHDEVRYRGHALLLDGPEGPLLVVLEAPADDAERYAISFATVVASAVLDPPAPLVGGPGSLPTDPFLDRFGDGSLTLSLEADGGHYSGLIEVDANRYPLRASGDGSGLVGTFTSAGHDFFFRAEFDHGTLVFETGGARYRLQRLRAP